MSTFLTLTQKHCCYKSPRACFTHDTCEMVMYRVSVVLPIPCSPVKTPQALHPTKRARDKAPPPPPPACHVFRPLESACARERKREGGAVARCITLIGGHTLVCVCVSLARFLNCVLVLVFTPDYVFIQSGAHLNGPCVTPITITQLLG